MIGEYHKIQRENRNLMRANPELARKVRKLGLKNVGLGEVLELNEFLKTSLRREIPT